MANSDIYTEQGGNARHYSGTATCAFETGTSLDIESGASLKLAGVAITSTAAELNKLTGINSTAGEIDTRALTFALTDISTASSGYVVSPYTGNVTKIYSVIDGAITDADAACVVSIDATPITDGGFTIATVGSAAGIVDSATPSAVNAVTEGQVISIATDGGSTGTVKAVITVKILIT